MHLASARYLEFIGGVSVLNAKRYVLEKLLVKSVAELTRGDEFTLLTRKGAIVYRKRHFERRLADLYEFERLGGIKACYRVTDGDVFSA